MASDSEDECDSFDFHQHIDDDDALFTNHQTRIFLYRHISIFIIIEDSLAAGALSISPLII